MSEQRTRDASVLEAAGPRRVEPTRDLQPAEAPFLGDIPWGYGSNRLTVMPVDPFRLFVYWELTDEAVDQARAGLGAPDGECALRVYDTTYRLFDGTNANWHTDVAIHRPANNHYVHVGRPGITLQVDIGIKNADGFATIVRSASVEMPREAISTDTGVEWMTVMPERAAPPAYAHRLTSTPSPWVAAGLGLDVDEITRALAGEGWSRAEWSETEMGGRTVRWVRWAAPVESGAFTRVEIVFEGERRMIRTQRGEHVVFGPWHVTIHNLDPRGGHRVIDRWDVHCSWIADAGAVRVETAPILRRILQGYGARVVPAGSEARLIAESWASEALQLGASEWSWLGASEARLAGASEMRHLGASEVHYLGASETLAMGASESLAVGASEMRFVGASGFMGASEGLLGGASDVLGASETAPGRQPPPTADEVSP